MSNKTLKSQKYTADSITSFDDEIENIRNKPSSIGIENHNHLFTEILANAIDEAREGYGNVIEITKHKDLKITIRDYGRGIPLGKNSDGEYVYKKVLSKLWSGGKMDNNKNSVGYEFSLGTNGLGVKACNFCSDIFQCTSFRDGRKIFIEYEKGREKNEVLDIPFKYENTGTIITWIPSSEVFRTGNNTSSDFIKTMLKQQSIVNNGLKFIFNDEYSNEINEFYYENGVLDFIKEYGEEKNLCEIINWTTESEGIDIQENENDNTVIKTPYKIKCNIYFTFNNNKQLIDFYHNGSYLTNGGTPDDFIKNAFISVINDYLTNNKLYDKKDKKIKYDDLKDSLIIISDTYSTISLYTDQAKKKIDSNFMKKHMIDFLKDNLTVYFTENPLVAKSICLTILNNSRVNNKAEQSKLDLKKKLQSETKNIFSKVEGLNDCDMDRPFEEREIWLCEGLSSCSTLTDSRDDKIMATFPLRGRFISCLKASIEDVLNNKPAYGIIQALNCGIEIPNNERKKFKNIDLFNRDKLKYSKIIIAVDADSFGYGISLSLTSFFYKFMPTLLKEGRIYLAVSPRYQINYKDKLLFAYNENEKNELVSKYNINPNSSHISVIKGLGQLNKDVFWNEVMNPDKRILKQIVYTDFKDESELEFYFNMLIGEDIENRKKYTEENVTNSNIKNID